jgi:hypothetical protein
MSTTINTETEVAHAARWSESQAANARAAGGARFARGSYLSHCSPPR